MVHEALFLLFPDGVELLGHGERCERRYGQDLGLAACEQRRAVNAGDQADLAAEGADLVHCAAVDALTGQQPLLDDLLLKLVEYLVHVLHDVGVLLGVLFLHCADPVVDAGLADVLVVSVHAVFHALELVLDELIEQLLVKRRVLVLELRLADLGDHFVDEVENGLQMLVSLNDALVHDVLGNLIGLGLDHDDLLVSCRDGGGHAVCLALLLSGVEQILLAVPAENYSRDGAVEGNIGYAHRRRRADHCGYLGAAVAVNGQHLAGDDDVVAQVGGEQRAHGAVNKAGGKDRGQAGLTLAAHEAAGDAADRVELFVEVNCEREVIDAVLGTCRGGAGDQNGRLAVGHENGCVAQLRHLADLHLQRTALVLDLKLSVLGKFLVSDYHLFCSFSFFIFQNRRSIALENRL